MALQPLNSIGGFSIGESANTVIDASGNVIASTIIQNNSGYDVRLQLSSTAGVLAANVNGTLSEFLPSGALRLSGTATLMSGTYDGSQVVLGVAETNINQLRAGNVLVQTGANGIVGNTWTFDSTGNLSAPGDVSATGNVSGNFIRGNGAFLTGTYTNSDAANLIASGALTSAVIGGNVSATYVFGDGGYLSNINVANVIGAYLGSGNALTISTTGNITAASVSTTGNITVAGTANIATLSVTGNATVAGTGSNLIRRASGLVAANTYVTLDDISANVTSGTSQLGLFTTGSWQGTGWTETFTSGTPSVSQWINLSLSSGFSGASDAMNSQGYGCRCVISDQTPSAKMYQITVVRSGTSGAMWNISIERLV